jgi:threonine dehydrogenase-like Zn-dependent dehydrogenase
MRTSQVIGPRRSAVVELPDPEAGDGEILIEVLACGVCSSDRTPWRELGSPEAPIRLGHETAGRVIRGDDRWNEGDLVTGLAGLGFSTMVAMRSDEAVAVPEGIPPHLALGEPLADLIEALERCGLRAGDRVAVVGLGFMGLGLVQLVRRAHPGTVVGVDVDPAARQHGLDNGCDEVHHPDELPDGYASAVKEPLADEQRFDLVLEVTGVDAGLEVSGRLVKPYGTMCIVGYHHAGTAKLDMTLWYKAVTVVNGFGPDRARKVRAMQVGMDLLAAGEFDYERLITHTFTGLESLDQAYELMDSHGPDFVKSVLLP